VWCGVVAGAGSKAAPCSTFHAHKVAGGEPPLSAADGAVPHRVPRVHRRPDPPPGPLVEPGSGGQAGGGGCGGGCGGGGGGGCGGGGGLSAGPTSAGPMRLVRQISVPREWETTGAAQGRSALRQGLVALDPQVPVGEPRWCRRQSHGTAHYPVT